MTDIIKLLPLPEELACEYRLLSRTGLREAVEAYARAVAEHNVAARGAEIEALRAEVAKLRNLRADAIHERALANIHAELENDNG